MKTFDFYLDAVQYCRQFNEDLSKIKRLNWKKWYLENSESTLVDQVCDSTIPEEEVHLPGSLMSWNSARMGKSV